MNKEFIQKVKTVYIEKGWMMPLTIVVTILLALILLLVVSFNIFISTPANKSGKPVAFRVEKGSGLRSITRDLKSAGVVPNDIYFVLYLKLSGLSGTIQAGDYQLSSSMTPLTIADILTKGKVASRSITIPEGWTIKQIADYLEKQDIVSVNSFLAATSTEYDYEFLDGRPEGTSLEGFLFPDTYKISVTATAEDVVRTMLKNFDLRVGNDLRAAAKSRGYSVYQVVTLASIVEKEVSKPEDRKVVAGVFENRLQDGMKLQSDVTLAYALGTTKKEFSDLETTYASDYNTYYVSGLPRGPICNPGLEAINAVLYPETTDFLYFLAGDDGVTHFAKTFSEHEENVTRYLK